MNNYSQDFFGPLNRTLHQIVSFVPRVLVALALFALFYGLATLARRLTRRALERSARVPWAARLLLARSAYLLVVLVGLLVALSAASVNAAEVVAGLGLAGFALGFALKDIMENFLAGVLLLFAPPFAVGDEVTSGGFGGVVHDVQLRTTTLHTYDNQVVIIPNAQVFTGVVINHTRLGLRRYQVDFDTSLSADSAWVQREVLSAAQDDPDIASDPPTAVLLYGIDGGGDVLRWRILFWASPAKAVEVRATSALLAQIKIRLYDAGVPTPTATSVTILRRASPDSPGTAEALEPIPH